MCVYSVKDWRIVRGKEDRLTFRFESAVICGFGLCCGGGSFQNLPHVGKSLFKGKEMDENGCV